MSITRLSRRLPPQARACRGTLLLEVMVVISIVAILVALAIPGMQTVVREHDLSSGQETLLQSLRKAKAMARAQGTPVTLTIAKGHHTVALTSQDGLIDESIHLPTEVTVVDDVTLTFRPDGAVAGAGTIGIVSMNNSSGSRKAVTVSAYGALTS